MDTGGKGKNSGVGNTVTAANEDRFLFDFSPVALAEGDCSELKEYIENLKEQDVQDFRSFF